MARVGVMRICFLLRCWICSWCWLKFLCDKPIECCSKDLFRVIGLLRRCCWCCVVVFGRVNRCGDGMVLLYFLRCAMMIILSILLRISCCALLLSVFCVCLGCLSAFVRFFCGSFFGW